MLLQPVMFSTYIILLALVIFNIYLKKENNKLLYISIALILLSISLFTVVYTDQLIDSAVVLTLFAVCAGLMYIPCKLSKAEHKYYQPIYVITHLLAFGILAGMRTLILISNPFYFLYLLIGFSSLYVLKQTRNKLKGLITIAAFMLIRTFVPIDIEAPLTFNFVNYSNTLHTDVNELSLNQSKPVIKAVDYYNSHYGSSIKCLFSINKEDSVVVLITDHNNNKYRLNYQDNNITEDE